MEDKNYALKISLSYLLFGVLWILLSDTFVTSLGLNSEILMFLSVIKGWFYVGLSTFLIYILCKRYIQKLISAGQLQQKSLDNLAATYEELRANEEELRQQFEEMQQLYEKISTQNSILSTKEETIRAIFNATNDAIAVHDAQTAELMLCNRKAEQLFGFTLAEAQKIGMGAIEKLCNNSKLIQSIKAVPEEESMLFEWSATDTQGRPLCLETNCHRAVIGEKQCVLAVSRDIAQRKKAAAEMVRIEAQKIALLQAVPDLIFLLDNQGVFLDYNKPDNFELFVPPEKFLGKNIVEFFPAELSHKALSQISQTISSGEIQLFEYQLEQNGEQQHFETRFVKCGETEVLAIIRNITTKKEMKQRLEFLSLHDTLTGVYNRTYFEEQLAKIRKRDAASIGLIICDVDGLKMINDTLGHSAGDDLLKEAGQTLRRYASDPDFAARIGGDEFALLLFTPDKRKMESLLTDIKKYIKKYNNKNTHLPLSLSFGWAIGCSTEIDALFKEADYNMYREKIHQELSSRSAIVQTMMQALEARDFITEGHASRLEGLIEQFARRLQLPEPIIADLKLLAQFHDIGKVGIPDNILFKPGRLTPDEINVMRRHSEIGFRIAKTSPDLAPIADWILKHQEWWNGNGYPLQIAGEEIPLACRILALVDAFDAMTNDRPYRKAMAIKDALQELKKCAGTQFDPMLTELFIEMLTDSGNQPH